MEKEGRDFFLIFKEVFGLESSPVAVNCIKGEVSPISERKIRICKAILNSSKGEVITINRKNNGCFGATWHLGFSKIENPKILNMIKKFVVEGEKLFSSYQSLENLISQMNPVPDNSNSYFVLSPLEKAEFTPQLITFVCNPEVACRLLTLAVFTDGIMPKIKIGGPTCRMAIMEPLITGEINISFYDNTARKMCNVEKDKLLVSIPYKKVCEIIENIDKCSAGKAKVEFPEEFKDFLKKNLQ